MQMADVRLLCDLAQIKVRPVAMVPAAAVPPPLFGVRKIFINRELPGAARPFVVLHELVHIIEGHADELEELTLDESRYPLEDRIADTVAAIGVTTAKERQMAPDRLSELLRSLVPVQSRAWQVHRAPATAEMVRDIPDISSWLR